MHDLQNTMPPLNAWSYSMQTVLVFIKKETLILIVSIKVFINLPLGKLFCKQNITGRAENTIFLLNQQTSISKTVSSSRLQWYFKAKLKKVFHIASNTCI